MCQKGEEKAFFAERRRRGMWFRDEANVAVIANFVTQLVSRQGTENAECLCVVMIVLMMGLE
jgi:hypothetical protein